MRWVFGNRPCGSKSMRRHRLREFKQRGERRRSRRPSLEILEDRTLLSFSGGLNFITGGNLSSVAAADFNGDGKIDLAATGLPTGLGVMLGNGDGPFQTPLALKADGSPVAVGDF